MSLLRQKNTIVINFLCCWWSILAAFFLLRNYGRLGVVAIHQKSLLVCLSQTWETNCSRWICLDNFFNTALLSNWASERKVSDGLIDRFDQSLLCSKRLPSHSHPSVWSIYDINVKVGRWKDRRNRFRCNLSDIFGSPSTSTFLLQPL